MGAADSSPTRIRDFLYVDVDRIRGLLAQLEGGVVDQVVERWTASRRSGLAGRLFGIEASRDWLKESDVEHQRTIDDALLAVFEEAAQQAGLLVDVPGISDADRWADGEIHRRVVPGQLLRVEGATQVVDPPHVREEMERTLAVLEGLARFQEANEPTPQPVVPPSRGGHKTRKTGAEEWTENVVVNRIEAMLGTPLVAVAAMAHMIERLLGGGIVVRVFPCGMDSPDNVLVGTLADRSGFLRDDRATLFAKYGWSPSQWTVVSQIATVPRPPEKATSADGESSSDSEELSRLLGGASKPEADQTDTSSGTDVTDEESGDDDSSPSRADIEQLAVSFMGVLAETGLTDVPRFPGLTMSPLAIYRDVATPFTN